MGVRFYFAYIDPDAVFDEGTHAREDEKIVSFTFQHDEGSFGLLTVTIENPRIGLLAPGRKRWAFLSWDDGTGTIACLFKGRIVAVPSDIIGNLVVVQFIARPLDYGAQKAALADTLRELPYYDPVFVTLEKQIDPDVVLEGRSASWHIDRVTHELTVSDLLQGEDGVETFGENEVPYNSVQIAIEQPPVRRVHVEATVPWTQTVAGEGLTLLRNKNVVTVAGKGLIGGWPEAGKALEGGWSVTYSRAESMYGNLTDEEWANWYRGRSGAFTLRPFPSELIIISSFQDTTTNSPPIYNIHEGSTTYFIVVKDSIMLDLQIGYAADRARTDTVIFDLVAESQSIVVDPDDQDQIILQVTGNDVGLPIASEANAIPIGDVQRRSYFTQDRGRLSLQYLIQLARARIILRSRAVKVTFKCKFSRAAALSLRKNALLYDNRLPGGRALGKIVSYSFSAVKGEISGTCTLASCVGYGGAWEEVEGTPQYVEDSCLADGIQGRDGQWIILGVDDVAFQPLLENAADDGLIFPLTAIPVTAGPIVNTIEVLPRPTVEATTTTEMQADDCGNTTMASISSSLDTGPWTEWLSNVKTTVDFTLPPVEGGPFPSYYYPGVARLRLPQQIDLEEFNT